MSDSEENIGIALDAINEIGNEIEWATIPALGERLHQLNELQSKVKYLKDQVELNLIEMMEQDDIHLPGIGHLQRRTGKASTAGSDWEAMRQDGYREIRRKVAMDKATGELRKDWQLVSNETIELMEAAFGKGTPKKPYKDLLHLDSNEYMVWGPGSKSVRIEPEVN